MEGEKWWEKKSKKISAASLIIHTKKYMKKIEQA